MYHSNATLHLLRNKLGKVCSHWEEFHGWDLCKLLRWMRNQELFSYTGKKLVFSFCRFK